jgi:hypothetical protein
MLFHTNRFPSLLLEDFKLDLYTYIWVALMIVYIVRFTTPISSKGRLKQSILHCHTYGAMLYRHNLFNLVTINSRRVKLLAHGHLLPPQGRIATNHSK